MTDANNQKATEPTADEVKAELEKTKSALMKREEDSAYLLREIEKLKGAKGERDKMLDDKAKTGDPDAIKKIKDELRIELADKEESFKKEKAQLLAELKSERVVAKGLQAAAALFNSDALDLIQMKIERQCDWDNGNIIIKDDKGEPRYSEKNRREYMSMNEYLEELATKHPSLAKASGTAGFKDSGEKQHNRNGRSISLSDLAGLSNQEQKEALKGIDPKQATAMLKSLF